MLDFAKHNPDRRVLLEHCYAENKGESWGNCKYHGIIEYFGLERILKIIKF